MEPTTMQPTDPRTLGKRLQEARRARGLTQQQAAEHIDVARTTIVAIEKGERRVQAGELVRLAALYGRQVGEFLRQGEPVEAFPLQFRAPSGLRGITEQEIAAARSEFLALCEDYLELERINDAPLPRSYPAIYDIDRIAPIAAGEDVAVAERNRLGLGDGPLPNLRQILENDVGLRIFAVRLPSKIAAMYAYTELLGACVAVNNQHPVERGRMSMAHDYGHFLTSRTRPEVCAAGYTRIPEHERFAESFAHAFLMPATGLRRRFHEIRRSRDGKITAADLLLLAHQYRVSFAALAGRLEDLKLVPPGTGELLKQRGLRVREAQRLLDLPPSEAAEPTLPARYEYLAVLAYDRDELSEGQLRRFLRVELVEARRIAEERRQDLVVSEDGHLEIIPHDLSASLPAGSE